jgi:thiamine-phosphate pyrophosphorylase
MPGTPQFGPDSHNSDGEPYDVPKFESTPPFSLLALSRILDANENRASEGLRVIEDYFRFSCEDGHLATRCKQIRHEIATASQALGLPPRLEARDASRDVGRNVSTTQELTRNTAADVLQANFKRIEQALRSMEEWAKTQQADVARRLEQLRYEVYILESESYRRSHPLMARLRLAKLYVLVDGGSSPADFAERVSELVAAGVDVLQLRDKQLSDRQLLERSEVLRELTADAHPLCLINDRVDVALAVKADGVHLGQDDLLPEVARRMLGPVPLVGLSTHTLAQAELASAAGVSYIGVGPTYPSRTKTFETFAGTDFLRQVANAIDCPAFAIGGIGLDNLAEVLNSNIQRVAVSSAIWQAESPATAARAFLDVLRPGNA